MEIEEAYGSMIFNKFNKLKASGELKPSKADATKSKENVNVNVVMRTKSGIEKEKSPIREPI